MAQIHKRQMLGAAYWRPARPLSNTEGMWRTSGWSAKRPTKHLICVGHFHAGDKKLTIVKGVHNYDQDKKDIRPA